MMKMTTNEEVVEAIIIKTTAYKENDLILHVYTKEYGKIGILARGVKKLTSKNARACQPLMMSEMTIRLKKGLNTLIKATPMHYFRHIQEHIESEIVANYIMEYYFRYVDENQPNEREYQTLYDAFIALDAGYQPLLVYLLFNVFILDHNGVSMNVDECVLCHSTKVVSLSIEDGGFLCPEHVGNHYLYDKELLKAFRHIHKIDMAHIDKLHISNDVIKALIPIIDESIEEYTGIYLKTKMFIKQIV